MSPTQSLDVMRIQRNVPLSDANQKVVNLAYRLWLTRAFHGGSPEEDLLTALRMVEGQTAAVLFVVPKCKSSLPAFVGMRCHLMKGES